MERNQRKRRGIGKSVGNTSVQMVHVHVVMMISKTRNDKDAERNVKAKDTDLIQDLTVMVTKAQIGNVEEESVNMMTTVGQMITMTVIAEVEDVEAEVRIAHSVVMNVILGVTGQEVHVGPNDIRYTVVQMKISGRRLISIQDQSNQCSVA